MHLEIHNFLRPYIDSCRNGKKVLEVGSRNVNGSARSVLPISIGVDMEDGAGVDLVCKGEDLPRFFEPDYFDVVVSCETLEHVEYWREFIHGIWSVLKTDGLFICTLASLKKRRHAYPDDYWRMQKEHVHEIFKDQEILQIKADISNISFGFVVKKKAPLVELSTIYLIPVDDKVPKRLLPIDLQ